MSKQPLSGGTSEVNGETTGNSRPSVIPMQVELRVHDDVALDEIELYTDLLAAVAADDREAVERVIGPGYYRPDSSAECMPVSIYIANESVHAQVEEAVEEWLDSAHIAIVGRGKPVIGSWFQRIRADVKKAAMTPAGREAVLTATHIADSHLVQAQDAHVTATLLQNVGPVLQALQPTKDAVVRAGALLIVKIDWAVQVHQLTAVQQAILDHQPKLVSSPAEIIAVLRLQDADVQEIAIESITRQDGGGEGAAAAN
jgi:hypothetical protein